MDIKKDLSLEKWKNISMEARDFLLKGLTINPTERPSAANLLRHKWMASHFDQIKKESKKP